MSSPPNDSSSLVNCLENIFLYHLMRRIQVQHSDYQDDGQRAIYREESRIEAEVVYRILSGKSNTPKPNSGETVMIHESSIAVRFHVEEEGEYIVWEWHGHIPRYTEDHEFSHEYIYGNYFQRIVFEDTPPRVDATTDKGLKDMCA